MIVVNFLIQSSANDITYRHTPNRNIPQIYQYEVIFPFSDKIPKLWFSKKKDLLKKIHEI